MALFCDGSTMSRNGIKIKEEAVNNDLCSYLATGRAVLNGKEARNFKEHLMEHMDHSTMILLVEWEALKRRDITAICRMFGNTVIGLPYMAASMSKDDAIKTIRNICLFHDLHAEDKELNGMLFLTDEKSSMLKNLVSSPDALNDAIMAAQVMDKIRDELSIPIVVDEHICNMYYKNKEIYCQKTTRGIKRSAMDDTFTSNLQRQPRQPVPLDEKLSLDLKLAKEHLKKCQEVSGVLLMCRNEEKQDYVLELESNFNSVEYCLETLDETLDSVRTNALMEVDELKKRLKQTKKNKEAAEEDLQRHQNQADKITEAQIGNIKALEAKLNEITMKHSLEQDAKDALLDVAEKEQKNLKAQLAEINETNLENIRRLNEKIEDAQNDATAYAEQLKDAMNRLGDLSKTETESKCIKMEVESIRVDKALSPIKFDQQDQTRFYSEEESDEDDAVSTTTSLKKFVAKKPIINNTSETKSTFIATPAKFGLPTWNELETTFLEHLMRCERGMKYAEQKKLSLAEQQNLLLQTLPQDYQYVCSFLEESDKQNMGKFKSKLMELIIGTNWDQSSTVLNAQRKTGEKILSFFMRLVNMYSFCTSKNENDLNEDTWFCMMCYQKILETIPLAAKAEFQRDCESSMCNENGTRVLKFTVLKSKIVSISRKAVMFQPIGNQITVMTGLDSNAQPSD